MVVFGDADDNVHHIRYATAAFGATVEFAIDFGGHDQLPWIGLEQIKNDVLDLFAGNHVALAYEHDGVATAGGLLRRIKRLH